MKKNSKMKSKRGFTLIELVIVIALGSMITAGVAVLITQGRGATVNAVEAGRMRSTVAGLSEYKMYKGSFPLQAVMSTTWPAALTTYVPTEFQVGGTAPHGYQCDAVSKSVTLRSPAFNTATEGTGARVKLIDSGICDSTSPALTALFEVDCIVTPFKATAGCI